MFGGSRGYRAGQSEEVGFEVMEAGFNAKLLSLPTKDLLEKLKKEIKEPPVIKFYSIDIHSLEYPARTFSGEDFEFISIDPCEELSGGVAGLIKSKKIRHIPLKLVACDKGAVARTQRLAEKLGNLQIIYLEKSCDGLDEAKSVIIVDLAPAIYRAIQVQ